MFLQVSVCRLGSEGHMWRGGVHVGWGACVAGGHAWQRGGMHDRRIMHGRGCAWWGHVWWGGHAWQGGVHGRGHAWWGHAWQGGMHGRARTPAPLPPGDKMRYGQ